MSSENAIDDQKAANLARIRDNQRRSRARRKEYLQELEERYRVCEQLGVEASAEMQAAARRVIDENRRLRTLLKQHGYTDAAIDRAVFDGTSAGSSLSSPVADLEVMFGQRKMPQFAREINTALPQIIGDSSGLVSPTSASAPDSSSSSLTPIQSSSSASQLSHMYQQHGAYSEQTLDEARTSNQTASQHIMPYGSAPHWSNMYSHDYTTQQSQPSPSGLSRQQQLLHSNVPSLQTIKSEVGYGPQEEIDCQKDDAEYSMHEEQGYDRRRSYHR